MGMAPLRKMADVPKPLVCIIALYHLILVAETMVMNRQLIKGRIHGRQHYIMVKIST